MCVNSVLFVDVTMACVCVLIVCCLLMFQGLCVRRRDVQAWGQAAQAMATAPLQTRHAPVIVTGQVMTVTHPIAQVTPWTAMEEVCLFIAVISV